jgi:hypothetical protein
VKFDFCFLKVVFYFSTKYKVYVLFVYVLSTLTMEFQRTKSLYNCKEPVRCIFWKFVIFYIFLKLLKSLYP